MDKYLLKFLNKQSKKLEKELNSFKKVYIVFDRDVDGLSSCLIVLNVLERLKKDVRCIPIKIDEVYNFLLNIKDKNSLFIFLDLSLEENFLKVIRNKKLKIIWIDHHQLKIFSTKGLFLINPHLVNSNIYVPTSAITYVIFDKIYHLEELLFFASIGIVADKGEKDCKEILEKFFYKFKIDGSELEILAKKLNSIFILNLNIKSLVKRMKNIVFFKRNKYLDKIFKKSQKIIEKEFRRALKNYEEIKDFILYKITSKRYNLRSTIANLLSEEKKFSEKVIVVYEIKKNVIISLRNGKNSNLNLLSFLKSLNLEYKNFGGHKNACGATLSKFEFKKFLKKLKKYGRN